jgi:hypothetical protein
VPPRGVPQRPGRLRVQRGVGRDLDDDGVPFLCTSPPPRDLTVQNEDVIEHPLPWWLRAGGARGVEHVFALAVGHQELVVALQQVGPRRRGRGRRRAGRKPVLHAVEGLPHQPIDRAQAAFDIRRRQARPVRAVLHGRRPMAREVALGQPAECLVAVQAGRRRHERRPLVEQGVGVLPPPPRAAAGEVVVNQRAGQQFFRPSSYGLVQLQLPIGVGVERVPGGRSAQAASGCPPAPRSARLGTGGGCEGCCRRRHPVAAHAVAPHPVAPHPVDPLAH